jgi:hypothetical protein
MKKFWDNFAIMKGIWGVLDLARIRQLKRKCRKRAILEPRRRPTAKFQNDFALYHAVAIKLKHPLNGALIDQCGEAEPWSTSLRKDCAPRFLSTPAAESGFRENRQENFLTPMPNGWS